jgi:presenilin-like A22 family membrane protease
MKHTSKVTFILLSIFVLSQVFGLLAMNMDLKVIKNAETGAVESINYSEPVTGARPDMENSQAFWYIIFAVFIGTLILLVLIRFRQVKVWKAWFFLAVWMTIAVTLGIFIPKTAAFIIAFIIAMFKIFKPNFVLQNLSEILMYTGIALLFVPLLNVFWIIMLILAIAAYDAYAVWHSKHMIKMANFQTESKIFAGLSVPYSQKDKGKTEIKSSMPKGANFKSENKGEKIALLGGGDIAFPLIFSGVVMQTLILNYGLSKVFAFLEVQIITAFAAIALLLLFIYGKKDRFYPAMPFIGAACLLGYGAILLLQLI